ncbi:hypothetical protein A2630_02455 [Candidatus Woesebacteria bacterium RIFCSPHIGHO2_01_FULL_44_10]|uniref:Glycosyl transferase family 1 domain-containing protein n=1 Tax=Candidatus Woesebacteria bacterium RIFCSPLOWO2_01_FULL_44_14 TaxID=1802525 RepID=A0A1F8C0V2_9BACT|nr:MAG: hypothetical protein A2630_02455 [Candidatus Woesebacteria bacterium RIFCSPHIGHO2_01_FULL_44_10]OGM53989.1 MAG: hypothetical protein A3F62_00270 [Candidatus Woesebacteria bacterium RIFCSPHIGHO2_12_FULL_44_11]OGM69957.1 MAG: hypothetical protein A2975_05110 [Candidatus Woesebacteria bacterium RIFCSPLOWO2_01_FULL_44_14]
MRAGIYNPYLDTLGGGERYTLAVAATLVSVGYDVDLESKDPQILAKLAQRFGVDTRGMRVVESINRGSGYEVCFWLSDGSIPRLMARNNILHFQRPFWNVDGKSLLNRMKFFRINSVVVNSKFTKKWIDREFPKESIVIYPPVDVAAFRPKKKENIILYVGRFSRLEQSKRQDILIESFKKLYDRGLKEWKLVLAGGVEVGVGDWLSQLKESAKTYPIKIMESPDFGELKQLYGKTKIFWSAAGFGVDENRQPNKVEHFGISVVEAMAAGAVPIAYAAGGHKEIIEDGKNGYLWTKESDFRGFTRKLANDPKLMKQLARQAQSDAQKYGYERFKKEFFALL